MKHAVKSLFAVAALGATGLLLLADAAEKCSHSAQTAHFAVHGSCGPDGILTLSSPKDACDLTVSGAEDLNLPPQGRFSYGGQDSKPVYKLDQGWWTLTENRVFPAGSLSDGGSPADGGQSVLYGYRECISSLEDGVLYLRCTERAQDPAETEPRVVSTCESVLTPR